MCESDGLRGACKEKCVSVYVVSESECVVCVCGVSVCVMCVCVCVCVWCVSDGRTWYQEK